MLCLFQFERHVFIKLRSHIANVLIQSFLSNVKRTAQNVKNLFIKIVIKPFMWRPAPSSSCRFKKVGNAHSTFHIKIRT